MKAALPSAQTRRSKDPLHSPPAQPYLQRERSGRSHSGAGWWRNHGGLPLKRSPKRRGRDPHPMPRRMAPTPEGMGGAHTRPAEAGEVRREIHTRPAGAGEVRRETHAASGSGGGAPGNADAAGGSGGGAPGNTDAAGGIKEGPPDTADARERKRGGNPGGGTRANQSARPETCPYIARASLSRRRGEPRGKERPNPKRRGRGRSPVKKLRSPEVSSQSTSGSESDYSWSEWPDEWSVTDSDQDYLRIDKCYNHRAPTWAKGKFEKERTPLTDWRKIKTACAEWAPSATLAFPVRVGGQGGNQRALHLMFLLATQQHKIHTSAGGTPPAEESL
ncbi:translation initiation factor IF-2-like [Corvus hawaiiensis]|uniref:translation initiation factor IF-2-like n=1 Tax=Corvus hawaiiensis TaxID=134902 RepID=UPI002018D4B4|nr:translation initiation factor IF-2-like [Corvus hawaiiensis]